MHARMNSEWKLQNQPGGGQKDPTITEMKLAGSGRSLKAGKASGDMKARVVGCMKSRAKVKKQGGVQN